VASLHVATKVTWYRALGGGGGGGGGGVGVGVGEVGLDEAGTSGAHATAQSAKAASRAATSPRLRALICISCLSYVSSAGTVTGSSDGLERGAGSASRISVGIASASLLPTLGVDPVLGRGSVQEDEDGAGVGALCELSPDRPG
jgi:hypothetical protein